MDGPVKLHLLNDKIRRRESGRRLREKGVRACDDPHPEVHLPFFEESYTLQEHMTDTRIQILRCQHPDADDYNGMPSRAPVSFYGDDRQLHLSIDTLCDGMEAAANFEGICGAYAPLLVAGNGEIHYDKASCKSIKRRYPNSFLVPDLEFAFIGNEVASETLDAMPDDGFLQTADVIILIQQGGRCALEYFGRQTMSETEEQDVARANIYLSEFHPRTVRNLIEHYAQWVLGPKLNDLVKAARIVHGRKPFSP